MQTATPKIRKPCKHIVVSLETYERLRSFAHYGQTMAGVIQELLDIVDKTEQDNDKPAIMPKER
jgi:hypothetical protein